MIAFFVTSFIVVTDAAFREEVMAWCSTMKLIAVSFLLMQTGIARGAMELRLNPDFSILSIPHPSVECGPIELWGMVADQDIGGVGLRLNMLISYFVFVPDSMIYDKPLSAVSDGRWYACFDTRTWPYTPLAVFRPRTES